MEILRNQVLEQEGKKPIVYDVYYNSSRQQKPVVIFCHGYKGFKDWGAWNLVAEAFAEAGFFFLKFNFSNNGGTVQQPLDFPDLEAFAQNNYLKELDDLEAVINFVANTKQFYTEADVNTISLIGHSRGGGIVLIKAEENTLIKKVVTWAGVSDYKARFNEGSEAFNKWKKTGRTYVENGRTKQQMPHDWQFYTTFVQHEKRLTIQRAIEQLTKPCLIIHGTHDTTVPLQEAQKLHAWNPKTSLKVIDGGDHVFGASHPWQQQNMPEALREVVFKTCSFLTS